MAETVGVGKIDVNLARGDERGEQGWKHINLCQKGDTTVALSN